MPFKVGSTAIGEIYVGSQKIKEAYVGSTLVYQLSGPGPGPGPSAVWSPNPLTGLYIHQWSLPTNPLSTCTASSSNMTVSLDVSALSNPWWFSGTVYFRVSYNGYTKLIPVIGSSGAWTSSPVTLYNSAGDSLELGFYAADNSQASNYCLDGTITIN